MAVNFRKMGALLTALVLLLSAAGGAAAIAWDTETVNTATTSDVSGTSTTVQWYPDNSTESVYVEVSGANNSDLRLEIQNGATEIDSAYYENATPDTENASSGHYSWTVTHSELRSSLPSDYQGGAYDIVVANATSDKILMESELVLSNQKANGTTARIFVENASTTSDAVGNSLIADSLEVESEEPGRVRALLGAENDTTATFRDDVSVDGANTTVEYVLRDSQTADAMDTAAESREDGEWIYGAQFVVSSSSFDSKYTKVYKSEAPEDPESTYMVYSPSSDTLTLHTEDEDFSSAKQLSVRGVAGEGYSFGDAFDAFGTFDALRMWAN